MVKHKRLRFEYSKITRYIYIGTNMCCRGHFNKKLIHKEKIKADISLDNERIDKPFGVDYFLWLPVKNHLSPSSKAFKIGTEFMNDLEKNKIKMYIHCERGHGRAPSLVIAYLVKYKKMSLKKSLELVKSRRPVIHPNKKQIEGIKKFLK